ncbi:farnesol dehydrogenase-like isoform X2 [Pectinophora gossypiella]|uniref:farnesol dehydrogenase-like isoform X2 n=1 Tax=Pectinophora gossypiella TaxID=13191 RepID=UPI00214E4FB9|nr:farnesol dehydrogenase-like isoform X2 [Pectinophora gossypiella]
MERWCGKAAVVTGATGGIGSAIAQVLAKEGMQVVGIDLKTEREGIISVGKGTVQYQQCNITDLVELADTFKWIDSLGGVDVMVNCAGYSKIGHITSVGTNPIPDSEILRTMDVNIKAMIFCTRHAVDSMKRRGVDGHVVNINSIAGHYIPFTSEFNVYTSSKYSVTAFTGALANELATFGNKIKTTSISPGLVQTPLSSAFIADFSAVPALQPVDIANAVLYAVSTPPHVNVRCFR